MMAWVRHIVVIGVSVGSTNRVAENISQKYGITLLSPSRVFEKQDIMGSGMWLKDSLSSPQASVIVSPPIHNPFTYHVLMNRDKTENHVIHVLTNDRDDERWDRISSFYHYLSDTEMWEDENDSGWMDQKVKK